MLEIIFKDHLVQPPCNEPGHQVDQVAQNSVLETRATNLLLSSAFKKNQAKSSCKYFKSGMVVLFTQISPRTFCSATLCASCAAAQCLSDFPHSLGSLWNTTCLPWELLTNYLLSDFTPLQSVQSLQQDDIPLNLSGKQCRKASSYRLLNIFFVCTMQFKKILRSLHATPPPLKVCLKPQGQDAGISVASFCWRKTSKDEKHQREQQSDRDCEEWLVKHMCWCLLAMHTPSAEGKEATRE